MNRNLDKKIKMKAPGMRWIVKNYILTKIIHPAKPVFHYEKNYKGFVSPSQEEEYSRPHSQSEFNVANAFRRGEMAEWSIAAVLKTVELRGSGGSNPSLSAN